MNITRAVGDFRGLDTGEGGIRYFLRDMDVSRLTVVYVRKSDPGGHTAQASYLLAQEALPEYLLAAGVPKERLVVMEGDTGKSAWLSRKFRADLADLFERVGAATVGTVVARDMSRFFRDAWMKEPAEFCARLARFNTKVLTTFGGEWTLLDLRRDGDREQFMRGAREAAAYRKTWRAQSMASREMSALRGNYTGGPAPFGYAVDAGISRSEAADGIAKPPRLRVYLPHAAVKRQIMELSLLPHLTTTRQLSRYLRDHDIVVPPFDPETARESFPRSCLSRVWTGRVDGRLVALRPDEPFVPSARMLQKLLCDPLAIGIRLYGSGASGVYALRKHEQLAAAMDMPPDCLVRPDRAWVGEFPDLAICQTEEERNLFWKVAEKWSPIDMRQALQTRFSDLLPNSRKRQMPRAPRLSPVHPNPWSSCVWCLKHGQVGEGLPAYTHPMVLTSSGRSWDCMKDYMKCDRTSICSSWGANNILGKILDTHLKRGIRAALASTASIIRRDPAQSAPSDKVALLTDRLKELDQERDRQLDAASALRRSLDGLEKGFVESELDRFHRERVRPVLVAISERTRELQQAECVGVSATSAASAAPTLSEEDARSCLTRVLEHWETLPLEEKRFAVQLLVERVGVLVGDGFGAKEAIIAFTWRDGVTDYLVGWRGPWPDDRPWTAEEDAAIRDLWPSGCEWSAIQEKVLPKRTFRNIRARAREIGVAKGAKRSNAWVAANLEADRAWGERHPDVLYLQLHQENEAWCYAVRADGTGDILRLPREVAEGIASQQSFFSPVDVSLWMSRVSATRSTRKCSPF